jgi:hypothetical protein
MGEGVTAVLDRYRESRQSYQEQGDSPDAKLSELKGGTLEVGYPEAPAKKTDGAAKVQAQALNAEAP